MILEYACHGNLKTYLVACRESLAAGGLEVALDATPSATGRDDATVDAVC